MQPFKPFDVTKTIEELTTYRDGLQQQLQVVETMLTAAEQYKSMVQPHFDMLTHNPLFQMWMKQAEEVQRFLGDQIKK